MKTKGMLTIAITVLVLALVCPLAYGQDPESAKEPSGSASDGSKDWEFSVTPYIWMISLKGDATVKGDTQDVDVGFFDSLLRHRFRLRPPGPRRGMEQAQVGARGRWHLGGAPE